MAILSKCMYCDEMVNHRVSSMPLCYKCSGKEAADIKEKERWAALTVEQKLDELKYRLDNWSNTHWDYHTPIG